MALACSAPRYATRRLCRSILEKLEVSNQLGSPVKSGDRQPRPLSALCCPARLPKSYNADIMDVTSGSDFGRGVRSFHFSPLASALMIPDRSRCRVEIQVPNRWRFSCSRTYGTDPASQTPSRRPTDTGSTPGPNLPPRPCRCTVSRWQPAGRSVSANGKPGAARGSQKHLTRS